MSPAEYKLKPLMKKPGSVYLVNFILGPSPGPRTNIEIGIWRVAIEIGSILEHA